MKIARTVSAVLLSVMVGVIFIGSKDAGAVEITYPRGPVWSDSDKVACPTGTTFYKTVNVGGTYNINLCSISSLNSSSYWGDPNHAVTNARTAAAFQAFGEEVKRQTGTTLSVSDGWRSNAAQKAYQDCYKGKIRGFNDDSGDWHNCGSYYKPADPGTSNHEMGAAIDVEACNYRRGSTADCFVNGVNIDTIMAKYGLERRHTKNDNGEEKRSWDPVHIDIKAEYEHGAGGIPPVEETYDGGTSESGGEGGSNYQFQQLYIAPAKAPGECTSILPASLCDKGDENSTQDPGSGIMYIIRLIISIMTGAIATVGAVGIVISGFMWLTAREDEGQVAKAKKRILEIVIGIAAWALFAVLANLLIPETSSNVQSNLQSPTAPAEVKDDGKINQQ